MDNQPSYKDQVQASLTTEKTPFYKNRRTWIIIASIIIVAVIALVVFAVTRPNTSENVIVEQLPDGTRIESEAMTEPAPEELEVPVVVDEPEPELPPTLLDEVE